MATNPDTAGIPDVPSPTNVPAPLFRPQTPVAPSRQYRDYFGAGAVVAGNELQQAGNRWGEIAANDVSNQFMDAANKLMHGDTATGEPGYMTLKGDAALRARPAYEKKMDELLKTSRSKLVSADQQLYFDRDSRRLRSVLSSQMGVHADTQANAYAGEVAKGQIKTNLDGLSANADNPTVGGYFQGVVEGYTKMAENQGAPPGSPMWEAAKKEGLKAATKAQILAIGAKDPDKALRMTDNYKEHLGTDYHTLYDHFKTKSEDDAGAALGLTEMGKYGATPPDGAPAASHPPGDTHTGEGLSPGMAAVQMDAVNALKAAGIPVNVTSGHRTPSQNASAKGARDSQHLHGNAIDISLGGLSPEQQQKVVDQFLKDPRVKGFGYYPGSNSIHVDVREGANTAWGTDHTSGTVGQNWPEWLTQRVNQWRGDQARVPVRANLEAADEALKLTPQEKNLYQHHLDELAKGGVVHEDRSTSTVLQGTVEHNGRYYNIPSVWDGQILWDDDNKLDWNKIQARIDKAGGWDQFPSYGSEKEAQDRYDKMHSFMEMDMQGPRQEAPGAVPNPIAQSMRRRAAAIDSIAQRTDISPRTKASALRVVNELATADQLKYQADEKEKKDNNDKAAGEYVTSFASGQPIPPGIVGRIAKDPRLTWQTKEHLINAAKMKSGSDVEGATMTYGPGFWGMMQRIALPPGDPNRIADPTELLKHVGPGGDLTLAGVKELQGMLSSSQRSVNDNMVHQAQMSMMTYAKGLLSFDGESAAPGFAGLRDPQGEKIFHSQFVPQFLAQYDAWVKAGKNPWEFLTQENVDKMAQPMRDRAKMARDKLTASGQAATAPQKEALPPAPSGANPDSWATWMDVAPTRLNGTRMPLQNWAKIINALRTDPDQKGAIEDFDAKYGNQGLSAQEILNSLKKPVPPPYVPPAESKPAVARRHAPTSIVPDEPIQVAPPAPRPQPEADTR